MIKTAALIFIAVVSTALLTVCAYAQTGTILYSFTGQPDGAYPQSNILLDPKGNLFGTTTSGGANGKGSVYELTPNGNSGWKEGVIYSFNYGAGGYLPASGVIRDSKGNLYGTVSYGGALGAGAVFELTQNKKTGVWTEQVIYSFSGGNDGGQPVAGLIFDKAGNLYGVTSIDGLYGQGVVYELSPGSGGWTQTVLHQFVSMDPGDGEGPSGALIFDKAGNLYGTTVQGGAAGLGTVFEVSPNGGGGWTEQLLYSFLGGNDGANPSGSSSLLLKGTTLYGVTYSGGSANDGTIFELVYSKTKAQWQESVLYTFPGGANGAQPYAGLIADAKGNLYGTTTTGVSGEGGPVFELVKGPKKTWTEQILYSDFRGSYAGLVSDKAGNLYGTAEFYGTNYDGAVFEVTP